jgi:hypothetical protein
VALRYGCGKELNGAQEVLEHVRSFRHSLILRGILFNEPVARLSELRALAAWGEFRATCGCGFTSSSLQKSLEHATKGHKVSWFLYLDGKASACRSRKVPAPAASKGAAEGAEKGVRGEK